MIKCKAIIQIHGSSSAACSDDIWLCKDFQMPFVPVLGMSIKINEEIEIELVNRPRYEGGCCQIVYDVTDKILKIYLEHMPNHGHSTSRTREQNIKEVKQIAKEYKSIGWKPYK